MQTTNNTFISINPYTEQKTGETPPLSDREMEEKLVLSTQSFIFWRTLALSQKTALTQSLKSLLLKHKKELAVLITQEMGKPISQSQAEVEKSARLCEYISQRAPAVLTDQTEIPFAPKGAYIRFQPLGVILGIMPWNFPLWQALRFAMPALLSGNTVLLKPAPNTMLLSLKLEQLFLSAGWPQWGVSGFTCLHRTNRKAYCRSPGLRGVFNRLSQGRAGRGPAGRKAPEKGCSGAWGK